MDQATQETKATKAPTEYETVKMLDGREVKFAGKRQIDKTVMIDEAGQSVTVRFDFRNGETRTISAGDVPEVTQLQLIGHGLAQKCGDEAAGVASIDDIVLGVSDMMDRLKKGEWAVARAAGDSFSGASIVIKAICEVTGKSVEDVRAFLGGKLEKAKAAGEKLSRSELYASFRNPNSKTGMVIERLEREARAKTSKANADELLGEIEGM